jgi:cell division protein FtsB
MAGAVQGRLGVAGAGAMAMMGGRGRTLLRRGTARPKWAGRSGLYIIAFSALGCLILSMFILQALEIRSLRRNLQDLNDAQQRALVEQAALRERLAEQDDLEAIEEEVRERLGWVKRGEEKVIFIGEEEE